MWLLLIERGVSQLMVLHLFHTAWAASAVRDKANCDPSPVPSGAKAALQACALWFHVHKPQAVCEDISHEASQCCAARVVPDAKSDPVNHGFEFGVMKRSMVWCYQAVKEQLILFIINKLSAVECWCWGGGLGWCRGGGLRSWFSHTLAMYDTWYE